MAKTSERVPTRDDWGDRPVWVLDLDWNWTVNRYVGRSNADLADTVAREPLTSAESLRYMSRVPFRYYLRGYCECLTSRRFSEDDLADAASCLFTCMISRLEEDPSSLLPVDPFVMDTLQLAVAQQGAFEADRDIYGAFEDKFKAIKRILRAHGANLDE